MKFPLQKVVNVVAYLYNRLLHGRNVGGIDWPSVKPQIGDKK